MHELSIVQNIIDIVSAELPKTGLKTVRAVTLRVGEMAQVLPEALDFGFECLSRKTPLEGARLIIDTVPARGRCTDCGMTFVIKDGLFCCPECGNTDIAVLSGKELEISELEGM